MHPLKLSERLKLTRSQPKKVEVLLRFVPPERSWQAWIVRLLRQTALVLQLQQLVVKERFTEELHGTELLKQRVCARQSILIEFEEESKEDKNQLVDEHTQVCPERETNRPEPTVGMGEFESEVTERSKAKPKKEDTVRETEN